jgi:uncharacterized membrane protein YfcA
MESTATRPRTVLFIVIGAIGGLLSGVFGAGGGIVLVPLLVTLAGFDQRRAAATSLLAIVPTALAGSITYILHGQIDWFAAAAMTVGSIVGSVIGGRLLVRIPLPWLRWLFIALLVGVAIRMAFVVPVRGEPLAPSVPVVLAYVAIGLVMGLAAGLFGIGGGAIAVPALVGIMGISDLIAKGTSLLVMAPTSLAGTVTHARNGYVDWRAGAILGASATIAGIGGALIAFALPPRLSSVLFAILLLAMAAQLAVRAVRK